MAEKKDNSKIITGKTLKVKIREPAVRPTTSEMVLEAVTKLDKRSGVSLQAIKKHIADNHKVDMTRYNRLICGALRKAVSTGQLTRPKGKGASGSFKLGEALKAAEAGKKKKPITRKVIVAVRKSKPVTVVKVPKKLLRKSARNAIWTAPAKREPGQN